MLIPTRVIFGATLITALAASTTANAASDPKGIWFDHNGRGAVEIKDCADGNGLCGHVIHVKKGVNPKGCGLQILGNAKDGYGGWIYSPERKRRYTVSLKRLSDDKLRVTGNASSRYFSRTFTWNRAPDDIARCGETVAATPKTEPVAKVQKVKAEAPAPAAPAPTQSSGIDATSSGATALIATADPEMVPAPVPAASETSAVDTTTETGTADETTATETPANEPAAATDAAAGEPAPASGTSNEALAAPLSSGDDMPQLSELRSMIDKFASGKGGKGKCKYRIPYVGRTINVPCK